MTTLTAFTAYDSRTVTAFSATTDALTIERDSLITLTDSTDSSFSLSFTGAFKAIDAKGSYGTAKLLSFYSSDVLAYTITGKWPLAVDLTADTQTIDFPNVDGYADLKLFAGNDNYIGSSDNDWFNIYDNRGRNAYFGMGGNDYIQLSDKLSGTANGGDGIDLIASNRAGDKLTGGDGDDFFYVGTPNVAITDFDAATDSLVLSKSYFEERILKSWLDHSLAGSPTQFVEDTSGTVTTYTFPEANIYVTEGLKAAKGQDANFIYDLGSGKLYFDQDGAFSKAPVLIATFANKPVLTETEIAGSLVFIGDFATYRDDWEATNWTSA